MKLKVTYERGGRAAEDLLIVADASASVGAVAARLAASDPDGAVAGDGDWTISLPATNRAALDPGTRLIDSGIKSGSRIAISALSGRYTHSAPAQVAAIVSVLSGPDQGREFSLGAGTSTIGRDASCEIRLSDPLVSRVHAKLQLGDTAELVDLGSANGLIVDNERIDLVNLRNGTTFTVGESNLRIQTFAIAGLGDSASSSISFNRPPRLEPRYEGVKLVAPEPPEQPRPQRFPILPLFAPLIMGVVIYLSTHALASLIFVAMSPLMIVANAAEGRMAGRKSYRAAVELFESDISDLVAEAEAGQNEERERRLREHPSGQECADGATNLTSLLWSRWPDLPGFGEVRLGIGRQPSRSTIELPSGRQNNRALWRQLREAVAPFSAIDGVPVVAGINQGALGVAGRRDEALAVARGLVLQLLCTHAPGDLVVSCLASGQTAKSWEWAKWLPHCRSSAELASTDAACQSLLGELEQMLDEPGSGPAVLLVVENDAPVDRSRIVGLAERGAAAGVHVVWIAPDVGQLPAVCRTFVEVASLPGAALAGFVHSGESVTPLTVEAVSEAMAEGVARRLAPVVDATASDSDQSDLPKSVSLLSLVGPELATSPNAVIERWAQSGSILSGTHQASQPSRRSGNLRALIGASAVGPHNLDLRTQGPHALVGGTTGSGKSELLQSWILGMALTNSPDRVTFLLVDYKGGSAFSKCVELPHTIGLVTDLSPHLVRRALTSLSAELRYRETILHRHRAKDLLELEGKGVRTVPPSLVIVVDEFAALVQEVPEFVDGVVNVAQRGRSLGLHLILATQRPAGVIKDNLRANTNLRLALRMADEADSTDVIGSAEAASFSPTLPGRAVVRTGPGQLLPFQSAYVGGWTSDQPTPPGITIETFGFGGSRVWKEPEPATPVDPEVGPTDIERIVSNVVAAHSAAGLSNPRLPWLQVLAPVYNLTKLPSSRRDDELVLGVADDPDHQSQPTVVFYPDRDGNLAVYGTGGSGKSGLLRTVAVSAGFTVRGGPCHVYGIDFGSRGLQMLEVLPHVGSVVPGTDHERVGRLLNLLRQTIDERAVRYQTAEAGTITDFRRLSDSPREPRIILLVDGMSAFRTMYEGTEHNRLFETFLSIAADGRPVGVHVIVSADRPASIPSALASSIQRRVVLRLADAADYSLLGVESDVVDAKSPPGRGLLDESEIQIAVLGDSSDVADQAREMRRFAEAMRSAGVATEAPAVERLSETVYLSELPVAVDGKPLIGLSGATLQPVGLEPSGTFLVAGPPASGRTTTLLSVVTSVRRWRPDAEVYYFGQRRSPLVALAAAERRACSPEEAVQLANAVTASVGDVDDGAPLIIALIESAPEFANSPADFPLQEMIKALTGHGHLVVADGETNALNSSFPLIAALRVERNGIVLQPDQMDSTVLRSQFPKLRKADFPVGRGLMVARGGQPVVVQIAMAGAP